MLTLFREMDQEYGAACRHGFQAEKYLSPQGSPRSTARPVLSRLHHFFEETCDRNRHKTALIWGETSYTYEELNRHAFFCPAFTPVWSKDRPALLYRDHLPYRV